MYKFHYRRPRWVGTPLSLSSSSCGVVCVSHSHSATNLMNTKYFVVFQRVQNVQMVRFGFWFYVVRKCVAYGAVHSFAQCLRSQVDWLWGMVWFATRDPHRLVWLAIIVDLYGSISWLVKIYKSHNFFFFRSFLLFLAEQSLCDRCLLHGKWENIFIMWSEAIGLQMPFYIFYVYYHI